MDKRPVYPGAIPLDLDALQPQRNIEILAGFIMQAAFGTGTLIDGLSVIQTTVPSMAVSVGPGAVITLTTVDTLVTGFGSLTVDNTTPLVKMGINTSSTIMSTLTAPVTAGQSQNWLVEAQFIEADGSAVVLPYFNSANPAVPFSGPSNTGAPNNTARTNKVQLQFKGGTAAATGTQNTPTTDSGWVGVAIITIANGQTSILNANITPYSLTQTVPTKLGAMRHQLTSALNIYVATTGSDSSNSGLSVSSPFFTLQKAWNYIVNTIDLNGFNVTVNVANGTYTTGLTASGSPLGIGSGNTITFLGNITTPSNCLIHVSTPDTHAIQAAFGANINISGFKVSSTGTGTSSGVLSVIGSYVVITGNMEFGACTNSQIWATQGGNIQTSGISYIVSGSAVTHFLTSFGGNIGIVGGTITISGTPAFATAFAAAIFAGVLQVIGSTFSGSATGPRYLASANGVINTSGAGATYFPGNSSGTSPTGGQYS